jgi:hypothetical protein
MRYYGSHFVSTTTRDVQTLRYSGTTSRRRNAVRSWRQHSFAWSPTIGPPALTVWTPGGRDTEAGHGQWQHKVCYFTELVSAPPSTSVSCAPPRFPLSQLAHFTGHHKFARLYTQLHCLPAGLHGNSSKLPKVGMNYFGAWLQALGTISTASVPVAKAPTVWIKLASGREASRKPITELYAWDTAVAGGGGTEEGGQRLLHNHGHRALLGWTTIFRLLKQLQVATTVSKRSDCLMFPRNAIR